MALYLQITLCLLQCHFLFFGVPSVRFDGEGGMVPCPPYQAATVNVPSLLAYMHMCWHVLYLVKRSNDFLSLQVYCNPL